MKIIISDDLPASAVSLLQEVSGWTVDARSGRPKQDLINDIADADALLVRSATKVTKDVIDAAHKLKIIARAGSGVDNVDLEAASARGVIVTNAPGGNSISVAEHAFALMRHPIAKVRDSGNARVFVTERGFTFGYHNLVVDMWRNYSVGLRSRRHARGRAALTLRTSTA